MHRYVLLLLTAVVALACKREDSILGGGDQTIVLEVQNLPPLPLGAVAKGSTRPVGHYEAWISFAGHHLAKRGEFAHKESARVSVGKFNVAADGILIALDGSPFRPKLREHRNLQFAIEGIITYEPPEDTNAHPAFTIVGGLVRGTERQGVADLTVDYHHAFDSDFRAVEGSFLLDGPTSIDPADSTRGVWFMRSVSTPTPGLINLPNLPGGWRYEGFLREVVGQPGSSESIGIFIRGDMPDDDGAGSSQGSAGSGHPFPGSDFLFRSLDEGGFEVTVAIVPDAGEHRLYPSLTLLGPTPIPAGTPRGVPISMSNRAEEFPTARMTLLR